MADEKKNTDRKKALESAILQIEKQFGKGAIMKYGEGAALKNIEVIPTGCLALDIALGIGGIPKGRISGRLGCRAHPQSRDRGRYGGLARRASSKTYVAGS